MTDILELAKRVEALDKDNAAIIREAFWAIMPNYADSRRFEVMLDAEAYESAAMMLVPEGWWCSGLLFAETWGRCTLQSPHYTYVRSESGSAALALVAAALRAKEATNG